LIEANAGESPVACAFWIHRTVYQVAQFAQPIFARNQQR
jgi:hypothetical protein